MIDPFNEIISAIFNAFKNSTRDRQIGDRRIPNSRERSIDGPSRHLPPGFLLTSMRIEPFEEQILVLLQIGGISIIRQQ